MTARKAFDLSYTEALTLHSSLRNARRREERQKAKRPPFVPEPGRRDMALLSIQRKRTMEDRLLAFIETFPQYDPSEWTDEPEVAS